jgi:hypothetical protein
MVDHAWIHDNIAGYLADGLEPAERADFERHTAECGTCAQAVADARAVDRKLAALFADVRPRPGLEDRTIQRLRERPRVVRHSMPLVGWVALASAAVVMLGIFGAGAALIIDAAEGREPSVTTLWGVDTRMNQAIKDERAADTARIHREYQLNDDSKSVGYGEQTFNESRKSATADELAQQARGRMLATLEPPRATNNLRSVSEGLENKWRIATKANDGSPLPSDWGEDGRRPATEEAIPGRPPGKEASAGMADGSVRLVAPIVTDGDVATNGTGRLGNYDGNGRFRLGFDAATGLAVSAGSASPGATYNPPPMQTPPPPPTSNTQGGGKGGKDLSGQVPAGGWHYSYRNDQPVDAKTRFAQPGNNGDKGKEDKEKKPDLGESPKADPRGEEKGKPAAPQPTKPAEPKAGVPPAAEKPDQAPAVMLRKIIRSGEMEFEVDSFDTSVERITKIATEEKGFVATVSSEKLPNGKMCGSVVVRVPPDRLDTLLLKLRALGDLKNQRIGSEDVTKHYTDMESELKAARAMEQRLLDIIKTGKGEIKDLLQAEKELGNWRTKIEKLEGEIRYYNNLISLSTLKITLTEREIRAAFGLTETSTIDLGIEVEDVEKAQQLAHSAVAELKGRIMKSELKQTGPGQYQAIIQFVVSPDNVGPMRDRLKQLGEITRQDVGRIQQAQGGTERLPEAKIKREDVQFVLSLYNLANFTPREIVELHLACTDTEAVYRAVLERAGKAKARMVSQNLDRQPNDKTRGSVVFEVKTPDADAVLTDLKAQGEVIRLQMVENAETQKVTRSKRGFVVQLRALGTTQARETATIQIASRDVPASYKSLQDAVTRNKGRVVHTLLSEEDRQNVFGQLYFEVPRADERALSAALAGVGDIITRNIKRAPDGDNIVDSKVLWQVTIINQVNLKPRETMTLALEVSDVDRQAAAFAQAAEASKGRTIDTNIAHERSGTVTAHMVFDVPLDQAAALADKFRSAGIIRQQQNVRNPQVPEGELAIARFDITMSNALPIVASDEGMIASLRKGLNYSLKAISYSLMGLVILLPWIVMVLAVLWVIRKIRGRETTPATPAA